MAIAEKMLTTNSFKNGENFKAAPIIVFVLTMNEMIMCNLRGVGYSDKPTENYPLTQKFPQMAKKKKKKSMYAAIRINT